MLVSYHVHCGISDGKDGIEDVIRAANAFQLDEVGMSDHYVILPEEEKYAFGMRMDGLDEYVAEVQEAAGLADENLIVRLGLEVDFFSGQEDEIERLLISHPFDYVIGSVHYLNGFPLDYSSDLWDALSESERNEMMIGYWKEMKAMAESGLFDIAGHLDLTKKFGHQPTVDITGYIDEALDAMSASDMVVEVNTAGWYKPCGEQYPSEQIIKMCLGKCIPLTITSDSHQPDHLIRGYDRAFELLEKLGCREFATFAGRQRTMYPMSEFGVCNI